MDSTHSSPRPAWHLTPQRHWINDPNGLVQCDDLFHAFYQFNPHGALWGNMSWGHAVSEDLLTWRELGVAIPCTPQEQVFSGSAVVDHGNTSGLGDGRTDPVVAIYTAATTDGLQAQALAFSQDRGMTWQRYEGNPVLDRGSREFRDPKVFRYEGADGRARWVIVVVEAVAREVLLYSSANLRDWEHESTFAHPTGDAGVWECPDLFPLPLAGGGERWVMLLSTDVGDDAGGHQTDMCWIAGDFDGCAFTPLPGADWQRLDHGRDFYAGVTFSDVADGRRLMLGWASNWAYAAQVPTAPFRGSMSLARELSLREGPRGDLALVQLPVVPSGAAWSPWQAADARVELGLTGGLEMANGGAGGESVVIELWAGEAVAAVVTLGGPEREVVFDRRDPAGGAFHPEYARVRRMPAGDGPVQIHLDAHVVELFADGGAAVMTHQVFVGHEGWGVRVAGDSGQVRMLAG